MLVVVVVWEGEGVWYRVRGGMRRIKCGRGAREGNGARRRSELRRTSSWWSWWLVVDVAMVDRGGGGGTVVGSVS